MEQILDKKVGKIVAENFRTARVFTSYGIDFCCGGAVKLSEVCEKKGLDLAQLSSELTQLMQQADEQQFDQMSMTELIDHIVSVHHKYVEDTLPVLKFYVDKIARVHGDRHPELAEVRREFFEASDALTAHMKKEEFILFPYLKAMEAAAKGDFPLSKPHFGHVQNPISMMEEEHETEGERFRRIAELTNQYTPPADGCQTYRVAFAMLEEFEQDLHVHIHLENNLLFEKGLNLYQKLNS